MNTNQEYYENQDYDETDVMISENYCHKEYREGNDSDYYDEDDHFDSYMAKKIAERDEVLESRAIMRLMDYRENLLMIIKEDYNSPNEHELYTKEELKEKMDQLKNELKELLYVLKLGYRENHVEVFDIELDLNDINRYNYDEGYSDLYIDYMNDEIYLKNEEGKIELNIYKIK